MFINQILAFLTLLIAVELNNAVKTETPADLQPFNEPIFQQNPKLTRAKRMYALCPPSFQKIGNECYYISNKTESWLDAHFDCKDRNSKLAEPLKFADRRLRKYLRTKDQNSGEKWIGGMFNWQTGNWQYGYNGGAMKYQGFDDSQSRENLQFHCTAMDPNLEYKWSAKQCIERHFFICQHRMSFVNEKNRYKIYTKWNETYPNQLANEVVVYVSTTGNRSNLYRKRGRGNRLNQAANKETQKVEKAMEASSTSVPEYLPYNAYKNLVKAEQKPQEDIHSQLTALQPEKQISLKQRKRHSKPIKITGDVDLGMNFNHRRNQKRRQKTKKITTELPQIIHHPNNALPEADIPKIEIETAPPVLAIDEEPAITFSSTSEPTTSTSSTSTTESAPIEINTMSEMKKKLEEKALRRERLKAKLAQLTPEERQAFLLMKQQRADARKKGLIFSHSS